MVKLSYASGLALLFSLTLLLGACVPIQAPPAVSADDAATTTEAGAEAVAAADSEDGPPERGAADTTSDEDGPPERGAVSEDYSSRYLAASNLHRADQKNSIGGNPIQPLVWSSSLAQQAQEWAEIQAAAGTHEHGNIGVGTGGQNMTYGGSNISPEEAVQAWQDEIEYINTLDLGSCSCSSGNCGHFTNMHNPFYTEIGCGWSRNGDYEIHVCNYGPRTNGSYCSKPVQAFVMGQEVVIKVHPQFVWEGGYCKATVVNVLPGDQYEVKYICPNEPDQEWYTNILAADMFTLEQARASTIIPASTKAQIGLNQ